MSSTPSDERILERIADEFLERRQQGEFPSIASFCQRYPELAHEIPKFLRTIELMGLGAASVSDSPVRDTPPVEVAHIGGYRIVEEIGRGGMGVVYAAEQESLNRRVALKVVPRRWLKESSATERFKREAQATAKLHHTNIVPVFEVGEEEDHLFYAMQLIEGRSLHDLIDEARRGLDAEIGSNGATASEEVVGLMHESSSSANLATSSVYRLKRYRSAARLILQAAEALAYAHKRKIIHRDIKPSNLLLDSSGVVWLTDFGVAKFDDTDLTSTGDLLGTLRYMAPERFRGECDERADVYSLGLTLYELLSLRPAYSNSDRLELVNAIKSGTPTRLKTIDARIPRDLETIVLRAIEPEPNRRYPSAKAFAEDLRRFIDDRTIAARRSTPLEQLIRFCRRNTQLAAAFATIAVLMGLLTLGAIYAAFHFRSGEQQQKLLTRRAQGAEASLQQSLYRAEMFSASTSLGGQGGIAQVQRLTDACHPDHLGVDLRGWEWFYLRALCNQGVESVDSQADFVWSVDWRAEGGLVATADSNGEVKIWRTSDLKETKKFSFDGQAYSVHWSPDGNRLGIAHGNDISIVDFTEGNVIGHWQNAHDAQVSRVIWSPSGRQLASASEDGTIGLWDVDQGEAVARLGVSKNGISALAWSRDGRLIASGDGPGRIRLWDAATHRLLWESASHSSVVRDLRFHPNGRQLASASVDRTIAVYDVADGETVNTIMVPSPVHALTWNSEGDRLITGNWDGTVRVYDVEARQEVKTLYGHTDRIRDIAASPDGLRLATVAVGGGIKFFDLSLPDDNLLFSDGISRGRNCAAWGGNGSLAISDENDLVVWDSLKGRSRRFVGHAKQLSCIRWSPNGRYLATSAYKEPARIWDVETGETIQILDVGATDTFAVAWSPNSELVAVAHDGITVFWDALDGSEVKRIAGNNSLLTSLDWHPDNDQIAVAGFDSIIRIYSTKTLSQISSLNGHTGGIECVRWSPDGKSLASGSYDQTVRIWDPLAEKARHILRGHQRIVRSLAWHPSGNRLASGGGDAMLRIWNPHAGGEVVALSGHTLFVRAVDWSPDGRKIVSTSWDGSLRIWDASRGYESDAR